MDQLLIEIDFDSWTILKPNSIFYEIIDQIININLFH